MLVESRVKFGSDRKAIAAVLSQVIGNIQTAIGYGTLRREGGIAVQVIVGDPVCQGDVIETAADGRIGIRFIDGTVFNLSDSTRVVLNEFVCDSTGTLHSALFGVTKGGFAIIAGQAASTGGLRVDTPFGRIRGRAHAGGFGMLSLTALTFSLMNEVRASDPNATFLDDDSITYKDFEHGVFELVTKEAVPRHIIVEDPGETVVLRPQGSAISVNQVTNSAARMAELRAAQQDALATSEKGLGSTGSSTPPFAEPIPLQPINFIQTDSSTPTQNLLAPLPWIFVSVPEMIVGKIPPPPPTLNAVTGPIEIDTAAFDVFLAASGVFVASSPSGAVLTFGVSGGTAGSTVLGEVTYDLSSTGPYGTLYVDSATGAYTFVPDSGAINALKVPTTTSFTVTVSDGTLSAHQTFTIAINGANDAAIISGITAGSLIEAGGVANATPGTTTASGTLTDTDVDDAPNTFTAVTSPTASNAGYGTFTMTAAGVWTYTLNNANSTVQALNVGDALTDSFTVTTVDGTAQMVTVTISGTNDAAIISGTAIGSVIEAGTASPGTPTAIGTLIDTDVDNSSNNFTAVSSPTASTGGYGTFTMTASGVWTYVLNNANSAVQALDASNTLTDTFTVTTIDGTAQVVTVTISGTNDAAIISGTATGSVIEAGTASLGTPTAIGMLTDTDVDNATNAFSAVTSPTASAGGYGSFTMTAAGVWTYTLDNANSAVQALNVGNTLTDSFTVTTIDGTAQVVTITITGSNDAALISGTTTGTAIEAGGVSNATPGTPTATGVLTDTDVDNPPNAFAAVTSPTASAGGYGSFTMTAAGVWTYTLDNANSAVQALNVGNTLTDSFTVTTVDGTAQVVTVTITGTNDAAIISGTTTGSVIEAGGATPGAPAATGSLTNTDVDNAPNTFTAVSAPTATTGGYGTFTMTAAGLWIYTLDNANSAVQALDVGDTLTDTFTVTTIDGTAMVVSITIKGASDADPNDFDHLATGTEVITDPPFVFGTPGGENIAGGGHDGQTVYAGAGNDTVNGTGNRDLIYSGSGNDTVKGNDGNDTIYGGSGSDTINGNNGDDTIIGGFGSDLLTGSNGHDRFVYLSVADSNADQFDVISDFKSGSDRINLTALGALGLAILALTSTSTSVPAHTIAWLYDSAANETIVYVNPTDHTLSIGNSGLLEIHLQGIAIIQASDFIYEPATAPVVVASETIDFALAATAEIDGTLITTTAEVSSGSTVSDSALVADGSGTTTDEYFSFDAARDRFDSIDHARLTSWDEVWTRSTEYTDQDAVIALISGPSIELNRGHTMAPTEDNFTLDQMLVLDGAGAMKIGDGAVMPLNHTFGITALNATAELHLVEHDATPDGGGRIVRSHSDGETGFIVTIDKKDHSELKDHSESKNHSESVLTNAGRDHAAGTHVNGSEAAGTLALGDSFHFKDKISGSERADVVKLADVDHIPASIGHHDGGGGIVRSHIDGETGFIVMIDKKDHSELNDHSESKNHSESVLTKAGRDHAAGTHVNGSEAAGTLALGDSFHFKDKISGSERADVVKLADVDHTPASIGHHDGGGGIVRSHIDGETGFIVMIDKKDHSESKNHSESVLTNAGRDHAAGTHVNGSEAAGSFALGDSFHFKDKISGSELLDVVDLADVGHTPASSGHHEDAAGPHGPPAISLEVQTTELSLLEQDSAHTGRVVGTHPHDLMV